MLIRPAAPDDAEVLTDLHLDVWEEAYGGLIDEQLLRSRRADRDERVERWRANISHGAGRTLLAWSDDGRLLGFTTAGPRRDGLEGGLPEVELWALYVRADVYGAGVGHALLSEVIGTAPAYLWVLDGNHRAISFYERQRFVLDGASRLDHVGLERRMVRRAAHVA